MVRNWLPRIWYCAILVDGGRYVVLLDTMQRTGPITIDDNLDHRGVCSSFRANGHVEPVFGDDCLSTAINEPDNLIHLQLPDVYQSKV